MAVNEIATGTLTFFNYGIITQHEDAPNLTHKAPSAYKSGSDNACEPDHHGPPPSSIIIIT